MNDKTGSKDRKDQKNQQERNDRGKPDKKETRRILERIAGAEEWRDRQYGALWQDCFRRYRSRPEGPREGSNLFVPYTFMQAEVIKARLEESLFAQRPYISALPREGGDTEQAEKMQLLLDWQLNERMDLPRLLSEEIAAGIVIYGTGVVYTGWQVRTRQVRRGRWGQQPLLDDQGQPLRDEQGRPLTCAVQESDEEREVIYDDPVVANIPLTDFFVDPTADTVAKARFCGHREYVTRERLRELEREGLYRIDWDDLKPLEEKRPDDSFEPEEAQGLYLLHHYWEDDRRLVFLNRQQCVCAGGNPFWHGMKPYDKCCYAPVPGEFYGMGVPELLTGLQDELNTARNQRIDYNSLSLRRMWKLRRGCGLTGRDLLWRQNGVLQVENMDDVQEINVQPLPGDAFAHEAGVKQDMQDVTGCYDILMGVGYANETATTTVTRDNNASLRFKSVVRAIIKDLLLPIAGKCLALDQQFLDQKRALRLVGRPLDELFRVSPEELAGDYDVIYCGTATESLANRERNRERVLQAYSLALSDPAYLRDDQARLKLFRKALLALGLSDAEELLPAAALPGPEEERLQLT
ncbi:MAG: hypothetical protein IKD93_05075 [Firmicutes bacterium]|nr:hypothetical protein [Bacillota bacterium]